MAELMARPLMARPARLSRDEIVVAAVRLVEQGGPDALTMKALGAALGADPSAVYRHVRDKDELLRAVGDHLLDGVVEGLPGRRSWETTVRTLCVRLRAALLARPHLADLARSAPTRQRHETRLTEVLLGALRAGGFTRRAHAAAAYHTLHRADGGLGHHRRRHGRPRSGRPAGHLRGLAARLPGAACRRVPALPGRGRRTSTGATADTRFGFALEALLRGLVATVPG